MQLRRRGTPPVSYPPLHADQPPHHPDNTQKDWCTSSHKLHLDWQVHNSPMRLYTSVQVVSDGGQEFATPSQPIVCQQSPATTLPVLNIPNTAKAISTAANHFIIPYYPLHGPHKVYTGFIKKLLLVLVSLIFLSLLTVFGLWLLDTKSNLLPNEFSNTLRGTIGYCIDGRQVYFKNHPFVTSINGACRICVCSPTLGGVSCQYIGENISCNQ